MKRVLFNMLWVISFHPNTSFSQVGISGIHIGSEVPTSFWQYQPETQQEGILLNYRHGLIILDFWASWCAACIKAFPQISELQQALPQIRIFYVNDVASGDTEKRIRIAVTPLRLAWMQGDSILSEWFPHQVIPHYVWIHKGIYLGATASVSFELVRYVLQQATLPPLSMKVDNIHP
jgi:thiol-disulfide isomerase/thioredoxin